LYGLVKMLISERGHFIHYIHKAYIVNVSYIPK